MLTNYAARRATLHNALANVFAKSSLASAAGLEVYHRTLARRWSEVA